MPSSEDIAEKLLNKDEDVHTHDWRQVLHTIMCPICNEVRYVIKESRKLDKE